MVLGQFLKRGRQAGQRPLDEDEPAGPVADGALSHPLSAQADEPSTDAALGAAADGAAEAEPTLSATAEAYAEAASDEASRDPEVADPSGTDAAADLPEPVPDGGLPQSPDEAAPASADAADAAEAAEAAEAEEGTEPAVPPDAVRAAPAAEAFPGEAVSAAAEDGPAVDDDPWPAAPETREAGWGIWPSEPDDDQGDPSAVAGWSGFQPAVAPAASLPEAPATASAAVRAIGELASKIAARDAVMAAATAEDSLPRTVGATPLAAASAPPATPEPATDPAWRPATAEAQAVPPAVARKLGRGAKGSRADSAGVARARQWLSKGGRDKGPSRGSRALPSAREAEPEAAAGRLSRRAAANAAEEAAAPAASALPQAAPATAPMPDTPADQTGAAALAQKARRSPVRSAPETAVRPGPAARPASEPPAAPAWSAGLPLLVGNLALVLLIGGFGIWSVAATLTGAVLAPGMIELESNRQVVQHPDGGVVSAIRVRDGDEVEPGDVLIELDGTRLASQLAVVEGQLGEIAARRARLLAERDGDPEVTFSDELVALAAANPEVAEMLDDERALFTARGEALQLQSGLVDEQNNQIENRITGVQSQLEAARTQVGILEEQLSDQEQLLERGLTQAAQVLDLRRQLAELNGRIGQFEAEVAGLRGEIAGNGIALLQAQTQRREEAVSLLRDLAYSEIELTERRLDLIETLSRLEVRAPVGGVVYNSRVFALQSVVQPADALMFIVPQDQPLIVRARVGSIDIDEVYVGQDVSLRFAAFDQREVPELNGRVARVSADVIRDEATGESYYEADIVLTPEELDRLGDNPLVPGMPVEAYIRTRERSALAYLTEPFTAFFGRAFRE
jgi:HlyD family secretion protein